jgi:hypothetical protein
MATLGITEELIQGIKSTLAAVIGIGCSSSVVHVFTATAQRLVVHTAAKRRGMVLVVAAGMTTWMWLTKSGRVSAHLAIVVIIARGSLSRASVSRVHTAVALRGSDEHRVIGMRLDMFLEILWSLEGLAAEITLMWFQRHMNPDVRGDVVALDRGSPA